MDARGFSLTASTETETLHGTSLYRTSPRERCPTRRLRGLAMAIGCCFLAGLSAGPLAAQDGTTGGTTGGGTDGTTTWIQGLEPIGSEDFVPRSLVARSEPPPVTLSHEPVSIDYRIDPSTPIDLVPDPVSTTSRRYLVEVDADTLREGVTLHVTSPQAIVWISPGMAEQLMGDAHFLALDPTRLSLRTATGELYENGRAFSLTAGAQEMTAPGIFPQGTVLAQLASSVGSGSMVLSAPSLAHQATYQVHVEEGPGGVELELDTLRLEHFHGDAVTVRALARDASGGPVYLGALEGAVITSEDGEVPLAFRPGTDGRWTATQTLDALAVTTPGPWGVRVRATGFTLDGQPFERLATSAFAVAVPTAGLAPAVEIRRDELGATFRFGVEVASPGRYAIQGLVYGTDPATGELRPAARFESADWLEPEEPTSPPPTLSAVLDFCDLASLVEPFEVRDLRLVDQSRMSVIGRRAVALRLADL